MNLTTQFINLPVIPPEVFSLTHLEELDLCCHAIQVIPEEIKQLTHLNHIDLRDNPLRQVTNILRLFCTILIFKI